MFGTITECDELPDHLIIWSCKRCHNAIPICYYSEIMACCGLFGGSDKEINDANAAGDVSIQIHGADPDEAASHGSYLSANSESDILGWEQRIEKNLNLSEGNGKLGLVCMIISLIIFLFLVAGAVEVAKGLGSDLKEKADLKRRLASLS
eukprot:910729_1